MSIFKIALRCGPQRCLLLALLMCLLSACSSLFFLPDKNTYSTPADYRLAYDIVSIPTVDGETLRAWFIHSKTPSKGLIYVLHGNGVNISMQPWYLGWLCEEGYDLLLLDYRGYGESSGAPDIDGALADVEAGFRWIEKQHPQQPLIVFGQSLGGALALVVTAELKPQLPNLRVVVTDGAFSDFRGIAREKLNDFWLTWPLQTPLAWTIPDSPSPLTSIARISPTPVVLIHSHNDEVIPFHHAQLLLDAALPPKTLIETATPHTATFMNPLERVRFLKEIQTPPAP